MANTYQVIDEKTWDRAMHCMAFRNSIEPAFCVTFEADITAFRNKIKDEGLSFTMSMVYAVCKCANEVEALRYRFLDGQIVLYEKIDTAFTYLNKDTGLFKVVNVPFVDNLSEYVEMASKTAEEQKEYFTGPLGNDVFQCSPMPWVTYTHISHTNSGKKDNATPLFDWGKFFDRNGRIIMPVSIQAHHSFVDGLHQILVAMDFMKPNTVREGTKWLEYKKVDVFFVTLNKSDKDYSPTTMYEDYSINEEYFHWQSQSTTSDISPTGQRYINHIQEGSKVLHL